MMKRKEIKLDYFSEIKMHFRGIEFIEQELKLALDKEDYEYAIQLREELKQINDGEEKSN